ncbi:hypothetical protein [Jiella pacifica]|uniref:DNA-binding protein n=1 Tax=Jiella pacifica TaxID=2696469 RepID=A0A6N9SZD2_9HYPH|nr:hypothetical protein [Jiella pacifica]NDW03079.1 hypothetical protein [Jiella pacifica]
MKTFEFSVIASGLDPSADDYESRFYDHGCDDALVSFQKGHTIVDFAREAESISDAISSAVADVVRAGGTINRIEPDPLVSLSDIATRANMSRAVVTQYAKGNRRAAFPAPVARVTTSSPLWEWASVACWLWKEDKLSKADAINAQAVKIANGLVQTGNLELDCVLNDRVREFEHNL